MGSTPSDGPAAAPPSSPGTFRVSARRRRRLHADARPYCRHLGRMCAHVRVRRSTGAGACVSLCACYLRHGMAVTQSLRYRIAVPATQAQAGRAAGRGSGPKSRPGPGLGRDSGEIKSMNHNHGQVFSLLPWRHRYSTQASNSQNGAEAAGHSAPLRSMCHG